MNRSCGWIWSVALSALGATSLSADEANWQTGPVAGSPITIRIQAATKALELLDRTTASTGVNAAQTRKWSERLLKAQLASARASSARLAALEAHLKRTRLIEKTVVAGFQRGAYSQLDVLEEQFYRAEVELMILEEYSKSLPRASYK